MNVFDYIINGPVKVRVKPNSKKTRFVKEQDGVLFVDISAPAENNKANIELVKFFSKNLKKKVRIKSGLTSKHKTLLIYD